MNKFSSDAAAVVLILALAAGLSSAQEPAETVESALTESRVLVKRFADELQTALINAMAEGGPQRAITVCKDIAPEIASRLSRESGAAVGRTSLRLRNPQNLPREWQEPVLQDFDAKAAAGSEALALDHFSAADNSNGARYMKAIPTGGLCLACHGTELAPEVRELLNTQYPHDRATGYTTGEVRGAFSVVWPREEDVKAISE
ncbi:Tll0287-like domain-containing protein [Woeseia oceani]|uniref:Tll0287-like domain-containing protein n=1 Tax=Woeseia oceani TaxID=1548547 RepID=UPI0009F6B6B1|nr:DUF3365 domain-containing protein [Woeseia oceani]